MDKRKLSNAARENAREYPHQHRYYTFKQGTDWLMQQPLSERLTEDEKEKIRRLYEEIHGEIMCAHDDDDWQSAAHYILDVMPRTFTSIFGPDLFKEK